MTDHTQESRTERRERERAERDHNRRTRRLALTTFAALAEVDDTVSGMTMISPGGAVEYIDADVMFSGCGHFGTLCTGHPYTAPRPVQPYTLKGGVRFCTGGALAALYGFVRFCSVCTGAWCSNATMS